MQVKDLVDIFTSTGGLLVSISTFIVAVVVAITTARGGKTDEQRTIRNQLTDTFNQMFATGLQMGQQQQVYGNGNYAQLQEVGTLLNQQYLSLLGQATFLANKIRNLVTPVEYNTLAASNANIGEFTLANKYAQWAIDACDKDDLNLIARTTSSYGTILFMQSNFIDGNAKFDEALKLLINANLEKNFGHYLTGSIYSTWAMYEKQWASPGGMAEEHFAKAEEAFNLIEIPRNRERALHELNEAKKAIATAPLPDVGQAQGVQIQQSIFNQMHPPDRFQGS